VEARISAFYALNRYPFESKKNFHFKKHFLIFQKIVLFFFRSIM